MKRSVLMVSVGLVGGFALGFFSGQKTAFSRRDAFKHCPNIHTVTAGGDLETTRRFLDQGVSANNMDAFLQTPILHAAWWGHKDVVRLLINRGADVNTQSTLGFTGLYWAVNHSHYDIAEMLLKAGAKATVYSLNDWTPLHEAAVLADDRIYQLLVKYGARQDAPDCWGQTPQMLKEKKDMLRNSVAS